MLTVVRNSQIELCELLPVRVCATGTGATYSCYVSVDAVRFGIQTLAPEFFGSAPDFIVSGPNVGSQSRAFLLYAYTHLLRVDNLGTVTQNSGTV